MRISHNRPDVRQADKDAVAAVLASGWIAQGARVAALEAAFVSMNGGGGACAVSSGTAALFLALHGLGIGAGAAVAVPSYSCSALLNAVNMAGARPVPVDVRSDDFTIDPASVESLAPDAAAVVAVHTFGASASVEDLKSSGRTVIEDCCQSLGGPQGLVGDAAVYSFYATKIVTGGQGGLVWDKTQKVAEAARDYREFDCRETYEPRFNFQMTDIQAAMIESQFGRLDEIRARRRTIRARYLEAAEPLMTAGWRLQDGFNEASHLPYRFVLLAPDSNARDAMKSRLECSKVASIVPIERFELLHRYLGVDPGRYPVSEMLADCALSVPLYPGLSDEEVDLVCDALRLAA